MKRFLLLALCAPAAFGATFLVPSDEVLVRASKAVVVATAGSAYSRYAPGGWIETVTDMRVDEAIKGPVQTGDTIQVTELGGIVGDRAYVVPGSPQYTAGERVLLFLETNDRGEWVAKNMVVGKFSFRNNLLVRDSSEIAGWDVDTGEPHREALRDEQRFLRFVRDVAAGRDAQVDYIVPNRIATERVIVPDAARASTYLLQFNGRGLRWNRFPSAVVFLSHGTQPGALGGGLTSLQRGLAAWTSAAGANVQYQYGGTTTVAQTGLNGGNADGVNTIQFNDPANEIAGSFVAQSGATLAIGGAWAGSDTHVFAGETFLTIIEADLVVQDGITGAGLTGPGFDHVLTHELGHTLGLRHSDEPPAGGTSTTNAIMNSSVNFNGDTIGSTLQAWDIEAIDAVYPNASAPACNAPTITSQPQSSSIINSSTNLSVSATGDAPLQYQWFIGAAGNTSQPVQNGTGPVITVQPPVTTQYWVRVTNSCGFANSTTATVTVNGCPAVVITSLSLSTLIIEGKSAALSVDAAGGSGLTYQWFVGNPGDTSKPLSTSKAVTVQPPATTNYWVRVKNDCGAFTDSDVIVVTVQPCNAPKVVIEPSGGDVVRGTTAALFVGDTGTKPETYQWFAGAQGDTSNPVSSGTLPSFTTPALFTSSSFWVRITNNCGTVDSQAAQLNVVSSCIGAAIVSQSHDVTVASGSAATLDVVVTGTSLTYQWYQGQLLDFTHPVGGSSPMFITQPVTSPAQFWVHVSSPCGSANSTTITVHPATSPRRRSARG